MENNEFDLQLIRAIIRIADDADLAELSVESGSLRISVKRASAAPRVPASLHAAPAPVAVPHETGGTDHLEPITAPMVGTFYRAPSPEVPPFVEEGDVVEPGQTVCIIEAMKLFNEIQSELRGRIAKVLAENGSPVEYGQPLFLIDPRSNGS